MVGEIRSILNHLTRVVRDLVDRVDHAEREIKTREEMLAQFHNQMLAHGSDHSEFLQQNTENQADTDHN